MFYFLSSSNKITKKILNKFNFTKDDTLIIFNKKNDNIIGLILNFLDKKYDFKINVIWCQRETLIEPLYRGSTSKHIENKRFNTFYLIGGGSLKKDRSILARDHVWKYNDQMINNMKEDVTIYSKRLLSTNKNRKIKHIIFKDMVYPYGSGYFLFDIKNYEPYTGFLMTMYFDKLYPNIKKTVIGFNCYQDRNKKGNKNRPGHRDLLDYTLFKSYCINRNIDFRFSKIKNNILIDDTNTNILFKLKDFIDIENPDPNAIIKCKNYDNIVNNLINNVN